jgi:ribosomal protein L16 Arg81 hydroxylase
MHPGDALFVPSMWWHHVESFDSFNLMVNYWWCATPPSMGAPTTALMHAMLSLRDLPPRQREAWRTLFNHYVFDADETVYEHIPEPGRGCLAPLDDAAARKLRAELLNRLNR